MEKHIIASIVVIVLVGVVMPVYGMSSPVTATYLTDEVDLEYSLGDENSKLGITEIGGQGLGATFLVNVDGEKVGVDMYSATDSFRVESEDIVFVYNNSVRVSIQNKTVDFGEGPLKIGDVYNLSEEQEESYREVEDGSVLKDGGLERKIIE